MLKATFFRNLLEKQAYPVFSWWEDSKEHVLSASNLWMKSLHLRHELRRQGVRPGDVVIQSTSTIEAIVTLIACAIGGFTYFPMVRIQEDLFINKTARELTTRHCWTLNEGKVERKIFPEVLSFLDPAENSLLILSTSGTQQVKFISFTEEHLIHQLKTHHKAMDIAEESRRVSVLSHCHSFGMVLDILLGMYSRQAIFLTPPAKLFTSDVLDSLEGTEPTSLAVVPRMLETIIRRAKGKSFPLVTVHTGGAPLKKEIESTARQIFGRLIIGYGLTECGPGVLLDGNPVGCEVKLRPSLYKGLQEILVATPSLGAFAGVEKQMVGEFLATGDLTRSSAPPYEIHGRIGNALKNRSAIWHTFSELEQEVKRFTGASCVVVELHPLSGNYQLIISAAVPINYSSLASTLEEEYGVPFNIVSLQDSEELWQRIAEKPGKSVEQVLSALA